MTPHDPSDLPHPDVLAYKRHAAHEFLNRGYSVAWSPDDAAWLDVYAENPHGVRETRAEVLLAAPSSVGPLCAGRVKQLTIYERRLVSLQRGRVRQGRPFRLTRGEEIDILFNSAPPLAMALRSEEAQRLYDDILDVMAR